MSHLLIAHSHRRGAYPDSYGRNSRHILVAQPPPCIRLTMRMSARCMACTSDGVRSCHFSAPVKSVVNVCEVCRDPVALCARCEFKSSRAFAKYMPSTRYAIPSFYIAQIEVRYISRYRPYHIDKEKDRCTCSIRLPIHMCGTHPSCHTHRAVFQMR